MTGTVYIVIYTLYHHIYKLALEIEKGLQSTGVDVKMFQSKLIYLYLNFIVFTLFCLLLVEETLSDTILDKMQAPPKPDLPVITVEELTEADGILFGIPTRYFIIMALSFCHFILFFDSSSSL
jgi:NAD(P)H dehydrogenase (quinone)